MTDYNLIRRVLLVFIIFWVLVAGAVIFTTLPAQPHSSPLGMEYPSDCCDPEGRECAPISCENVRAGPRGYTVWVSPENHPTAQTGMSRFFPYGAKNIRTSTDGECHACALTGVYCVMVPPPGT